MDRGNHRSVVFGISLALSLLLAWAVWPFLERMREPETVAFVESGPALERALRERAATPGAAADGASAESADPLGREPIPEDVARVLFPVLEVSAVNHVYDPRTYFAYRPHFVREIPFHEHPLGAWTLRTNGLGLREDEETPIEHDGLRILVTGDSHADGICNNAESFSNLLEARLAAARPELAPDVVNAAHSGYSFYNYLGVLEKLAVLEPDVFVVTVYGGNDFLEVLLLRHYFARTLPAGYEERLAMRAGRTPGIPGGAHGQAVRQLQYFARWPEDFDVAVRAGIDVSREIGRQCAERGIELLFVYLPPMSDAQPWLFEPPLRRVRELTGLSEEEMGLNRALADAWIAGVEGAGLDVLDLCEPFHGTAERLYWATDDHIDLAAHQAIAALLEPAVLERIDP